MKGHTPGPWRYEASTKTIRAVPSNYWLATMDSWDGAVDHAANTELIALTPDMLQMLQELSAWLACPDCSPETVASIKEKIDELIGGAV